MQLEDPRESPVTHYNECSRTVPAGNVTYCKVPLERLGPSVGVVPTNLTVVVDVQTMEFIQPVRDGLQARRHED